MRVRTRCQVAFWMLTGLTINSGIGGETTIAFVTFSCAMVIFALMPDKRSVRRRQEQPSENCMKLEPDGGNLYKPHVFQINSGRFWRCKHAKTGFGDDMKWVGCEECEKEDPEAFAEWNKKDA